jgi:hypothetical protein
MIFVNENWLNDYRCKPSSNLLELIERDLDLEEELKKFENSFEQDEIVDI